MTNVSLKKSPPAAWLMRTLLIAATTCIILGGQIIFIGWQGGKLITGDVVIPVYFPGGLLLLLGVRNLWSWRQMKLAIAAAKAQTTDETASG